MWYPILHSDFSVEYYRAIGDSSDRTSRTCLAFLVAALGSLTETSHTDESVDAVDKDAFIAAGLDLIPTVLLETTMESLQCLVFLAVYYLCIIQPCQAHDYISIASMKVQNMIKGHMYHDDHHSLELMRRAYWAILLIESELNVQLDFASSGIWDHDGEIPLPAGTDAGSFSVLRSPYGSPSIEEASMMVSPDSVAMAITTTDDIQIYYFLAEIAMRRILQRCTTSISMTSHGRVAYASVIAAELDQQLDDWYDYLPNCLRFNRDPLSPQQDELPATVRFLRVQYMACRASIFWPAVYQVLDDGHVSETILPLCSKFFNAHAAFVLEILPLIPKCAPNVWTLYARYEPNQGIR